MREGRKFGSNWGCCCFLFEKTVLNVTYSLSHRQVRVKTINIQSTLRSAPNFCQNISLAVFFGSNGNSHTVCTQSDMCKYIYFLHNIETLVGQKK